jgi:predicted nucleic acid-binding protein
MKEKLYLETSVISYYTARPSRDLILLAHQEITRQFWEKALNDFEVFISQAIVDEISKGDREASERRMALIKGFSYLAINENVEKLAELYMKRLGLPPKAYSDAIHIAVACNHDIDYLATWNCSHIANGVIIKRVMKINSSEGKKTPVICTPEELVEIETSERPDY